MHGKKKLERRILRLTRCGRSQAQIVQALRSSRSTVHRVQKKWGVTAKQHGPRVPEVSEAKILDLLRRGHDRKQIETMLGATEWTVRRIAEAHGITARKDPLSARERRQLVQAIQRHDDYMIHLADKFGISYKRTRRMARETLGCERFVTSRAKPPLSSRFPQRENS
jgi:transposase